MRKHIISLVAVLLMAMPLAAWSQTATRPAVGDGSEESPFEIATAENLARFRDYVNGTYTPDDGESAQFHRKACAKLTADIDMRTVCHPADADNNQEELSWTPISDYAACDNTKSNAWCGIFDGNEHTVSNLYINTKDGYQGLFGLIYGYSSFESVVKNIVFTDVYINNPDGDNAGVVAGYSRYLNVSNVTLQSGRMSVRDYSGGIVGWMDDSKAYLCVNRLPVSGNGGYRVGGIVGIAHHCLIENCANYGNVDSEGNWIGGVAGYAHNEFVIRNCANFGRVEGQRETGGIVGCCSGVTFDNVFASGDVVSMVTDGDSKLGFIVGSISEGRVTFLNHVAYSSGAKIMQNGVEMPATAVGAGTVKSGEAKCYPAESFESGYVAWLLQQNGACWGQKLGSDPFPVLVSGCNVYADGEVDVTCQGEMLSGRFTNTKPEAEGTVKVNHATVTHHPAVPVKCLESGVIEYYECEVCHHKYTDEGMTHEVGDIVVPAPWHDFVDGVCMRCDLRLPVLEEGAAAISVGKVDGDGTNHPSGYNLYMFVAPYDGVLTVYTSGSEDTCGSVWDSGMNMLPVDDNGADDENGNFNLSVCVQKGETYYIGVRKVDGEAIDGKYSITLIGDWPLPKDEFALADGNAYVTAKQLSVASFTYTRTFNNTAWQPLYVPFGMECADWTAQGLEVACVNNFHEYLLDDGTRKVVLEVKKVSKGSIFANTPYLIRAAAVGEKTISLSNITLEKSQSCAIDCSSTTSKYSFTGIYDEKDDLDAGCDYILSGGSIYHSDGALKPQRWYLTVKSLGSLVDAEESVQKLRGISIQVVGEGETTSVESIGVASTCFKALNGIYDLQGRRLNGEPANGVYIKGGKKYVK